MQASMRVHNVMEDIVLERVHELFQDEETRERKRFCTCSQCRLDVACYVLNRIKPYYMISGRGLAHLQLDYQEKLQREADLVSLIHRGIESVQKARRPEFPHQESEEGDAPRGPHFNFPQITGRLFNSLNFAPVHGIRICLLENARMVTMLDSNWQNPYAISERTPGVFTFWPYPIKAEAADLVMTLELELQVDEKDFQPFHHYFKLELRSRDGFLDLGTGERIFNLPDLYLSPGP